MSEDVIVFRSPRQVLFLSFIVFLCFCFFANQRICESAYLRLTIFYVSTYPAPRTSYPRIPISLYNCLSKSRKRLIFVRDNQFIVGYLPIYTQVDIIKTHTPFCIFMVKVITFIEKSSRFGQHDKAVKKTTRYEELSIILCRKLYRHVLTVRR